MSFERIDTETVWEGQIATVHVDRIRYDDGDEADRERVSHPGAVAVVAHDGERVFLVRQPREAVDEQSLLELPAGKLDADGEGPLETAKRELAEEIGKQAAHWESLGTFLTSPGFTNERVHLFLATGISDVEVRPEVHEDERIDVEIRPLSDLEALIESCEDSKTIIALARLRARLAAR